MRFIVYMNEQGHVFAQSDDLEPGSERHHLFHSRWNIDIDGRPKRHFTYNPDEEQHGRPLQLGYVRVCETFSPGDETETDRHLKWLTKVVLWFDGGRNVLAPSVQKENVLTPMWDFFDRSSGRGPLRKVKLFVRPTTKSKYDFMRW